MGRKIEGFTNAAMDRLGAYAWTGNVRELENEIQRAVALSGGEDRLRPEMFSEEVRGAAPGRGAPRAAAIGNDVLPAETDLNRAVDDLKRAMIAAAIEDTGSKTKAAERLGIPRQSLQKMMKRLEMTD